MIPTPPQPLSVWLRLSPTERQTTPLSLPSDALQVPTDHLISLIGHLWRSEQESSIVRSDLPQPVSPIEEAGRERPSEQPQPTGMGLSVAKEPNERPITPGGPLGLS